jgi:NitT/TauT family transport system substrate-binding protein
MKRSHILSALAALGLVATVNVAALPRAQAAPSRDSKTYRMIMNWFPEPEEGGFYNALREGLYQKAGINITMNEFGYSIVTEPYLIAGKADFAMGNADEILQYNAKGAKLVAVVGSFQTNPQGIIWHAEDTTIHGLADLSNHTLVYVFGAGYEPYLVLKYHYKNFNTHNSDFTSRYFALHKDAVNQCYVTSEPYLWSQQGLKIKYALIASSGYNPYAGLMFTTLDMVKNHPDVVRAFVKASVQGWYDFMKDPGPTLKYMLTAPGAKNYPQKPDQQQFSYDQMKKLGLIMGGDASTHGIGYFSLTRWKTLQQQMVSVGQKVGGVDVTKAFTDQFLPKTPGM